MFGTSCVLALADSTLCCCIKWIPQIAAVLFCHERRPTEGIGFFVSCVPHSCQVKTVSAALFCLYSAVVFTDQPRALQLFSAAVSPRTERCAGWLATPVRHRGIHSVLRSQHCRKSEYLKPVRHRGIHSVLRSQHCRKSEYLKPRITYDSSCTCGPEFMTQAVCPPVRAIIADCTLLISIVYRRARLSTRCVAVNIFCVRLARMILLRERDDIFERGMICGERDDNFPVIFSVRFPIADRKLTRLDLSSLTLIHRVGDRCQAGHTVHALSGPIASISLVHICWANWQHRKAAGA